jgi:hypothetical protein
MTGKTTTSFGHNGNQTKYWAVWNHGKRHKKKMKLKMKNLMMSKWRRSLSKMKKIILKHRLQKDSIKVTRIMINNHWSNISKLMDLLIANKVTIKKFKMLKFLLQKFQIQNYLKRKLKCNNSLIENKVWK